VKSLPILLFVFRLALQLNAQPSDCTFLQPAVAIHFGAGNLPDLNTGSLTNYYRVSTSCPTDGHYSYASSTRSCFRDDWHTLAHDHTGDASGNMMLVNGAYSPGIFLRTTITGLKGNAIYEFGAWLMNLCKPTYKCPYPLLPNLSIRLETPMGKLIAQFATGEVPRVVRPRWTQYRAYFTTPTSATTLTLTMLNKAPGGCGNDFALDDVTFRECIRTIARPKTVTPKATDPKPIAKKKQPATKNPIDHGAVRREPQIRQVAKRPTNPSPYSLSVPTQKRNIFPTPPSILTTRENPLAKRIETEAGEIRIELYDNGEIDGDTVTIYHNNSLVKAHAGLSGNPITFTISVNPAHPHHELVMVADNLGSIPPNTSVMIITAGGNRYEVFISSNEQKNARVILDLK
jgi:hypothetical protein